LKRQQEGGEENDDDKEISDIARKMKMIEIIENIKDISPKKSQVRRTHFHTNSQRK
jgi:hypothetical protein